MGKSAIFRLKPSQVIFQKSQVKSSQVIGDSKKFQVKSSHTKIDRLGSQMANENWNKLSMHPNPVFISRYIYSAELIVDLGYILVIFWSYIFKLEAKIEVHKRFLRDIFLDLT